MAPNFHEALLGIGLAYLALSLASSTGMLAVAASVTDAKADK